MAILHIYGINSPIYIEIMYVCHQWFIIKRWYHETSSESVQFIAQDNDDSYNFFYELIKTTFELDSDDISLEIIKDEKVIVDNFVTFNNVNLISRYLGFLKQIDRYEIDKLYKSYLITTTANILNKTFPQEIIEHILKFI